jgi:two-component system phosphate regulon sensor histidine kinase PhoR
VGVEVEDMGVGIPLDEQPKIFERFFRAKNAKVLDTDGTGLGLSLVKMIVDKSGGQVWFDSEEGRGTAFTLILPYRRN